MQELSKIVSGIQGLNEAVMKQAKDRMDFLVKPLGSLGRLEEIAIQIAGITGEVMNHLDKKCTIIMASDHGVVAEGIGCAPQEVTYVQTLNILKGITGISAISKVNNADVRVVDIGVNGVIDHPKLINRKIKNGTENFRLFPSMSREDAVKALEIGIEQVKELVEDGYQVLGTGEMGIGNTSCSSAVFMAFTGVSKDVAIGKGGGLTDDALVHKKAVIKEALAFHKPNPSDPIDVLAKVGGFDLAGMAGCFLGAAYYQVPIVIDGFISAAAAYTAYRLNPTVKDYIIPSHHSLEPGFTYIMKEMGLEALMNLHMRLGEGTGCPMAFSIIDTALAVMRDMATFEEASIANDNLVDIR